MTEIEARRAEDVTRVAGPVSDAEPEDRVMSLVDHLAELRRRLAISILSVVLGTVVAFLAAPRALTLLKQQMQVSGPLVYFDPGGAFFIQLRLALMMGIALAFPIVLYQLWAFVSPGLTRRERAVARPWIPLAIVFFALGIGVAYLVLPYTVAFLQSFQIAGVIESRPEAERYIGFATTTFLVFGVVMQFPVVLILLSKMGVLGVERLRGSRRYVLLGIVVFTVVITPGGDPVAPLIMSAVMYTLYELTILLLARPAGHARRR